MARTAEQLLNELFAALTAKDVDAAVALFAPDAIFIDPHYPRPKNVGHTQIREAFEWVVKALSELSFEPGEVFVSTSPAGADSINVRVASAHIVAATKKPAGTPVQTFDCQSSGGLLTSVVAQQGYGPHGVAGAVLSVTRAVDAVKGVAHRLTPGAGTPKR